MMTLSGCARAAAILALAVLATPAGATTWTVDCSSLSNSTASNGTTMMTGLTPQNALGTVLGTPISPPLFQPPPVAGDVIQINSICSEDILVRIPGLTITNDSGSPDTLTVGDGIQGQLEFAGVGNTVIDGILIGNDSGPFALGAADIANLYVHDGASVALKNSQVANGPFIGILVARSSAVSVIDATVSGNGNGMATDNANNMGILATSSATVVLGNGDGTGPATIETNAGSGVVVSDGSSLVVNAATIAGNATEAGGNGLAQVLLLGASSGFITGQNAAATTITAPSAGCCQAIFAGGASTLDVEQGAAIVGNKAHAAIALDASTLLLQGSVVSSGVGASSPGASEPTIHGTGNSVVALAGNNNVCFGTPGPGATCTANSGGIALGVDHVSTLIQVPGKVLGYPSASDTVSGGGSVLLQSTVDLGLGLVSSGPSLVPSLSWNTSGAAINVAQNSSFRLDGGTNITGALKLTQSSNGFFNQSSGGTNTVSGGVACNFNTVPATHVAGPTFVSPTLTLAGSMVSVPKGQCLGF
ncbi:MAG TPA: hypothetical protein VN802_15050 [Stellaceae bacterium]|nr:hypothetical protein [Stellaceae bacterium]